MSSSGPAPCANRNPGFGCHRSGPWVWNAVCANSGSPMTPAAMARFAVWKPGPSRVSGAEPMRTPAARGLLEQDGGRVPVQTQRLLRPDVLAGRDRRRGHLHVRVRRGQVHDQLHAGVGEHVVAAAVRGDAVLLGLGSGSIGDQVADDKHLDVREGVQVLQVGVADDPDADDADADGAHRTYPPSVRNA